MNLFQSRRIKKSWSQREIAPEDIFIDSTNVSDLDENKFEGRLERPISVLSIKSISAFFLFLFIVFGVRLYILQVKEGSVYAEWSSDNRLRSEVVFANRGVIEDRNGISLAWNESATTTESDYPIRKYINQDGFAHLVGYVDQPKKDSKGVYYKAKYEGLDGIEAFYDARLSGQNGEVLVEENARLEEQSRSIIVPAQDGINLKLEVDSRLQKLLFDSLRRLAQDAGFKGGAGVVMDVKTGGILALASFPEYDPQVMSDGKDKVLVDSYLNDKHSVFLNRAVAGLYTPGSTVKPFIALASLNENIISPNTKLFSSGALVVPNTFSPDKPSIFRDWKAHGWVNMIEALAYSSNEYFFKIGGGYENQRGLGIDKINEYTSDFGLKSKTGIDLFGEREGLVPNPSWKESLFGESWRLGDTYNTSIGQYGFQITPIELARATAAIANGGKLVRPHILNFSQVESKTIEFLNKEDLNIVRMGMRDGVLYGTAKFANVPYVDLAAKTGTAELGVSKSLVNSWITGFFPYDSPRYVFTILMEEAARENTLGAVRAARSFFDGVLENAPEYFE